MKKIMLINHYNLNNGDKAVLQGTIKILEKHGLESLTVSAFAPEELKKQKLDTNMKLRIIGWGTKANNRIQNFIFTRFTIGKDIEYIKKNISKIYSKEYLEEVKMSDVVLISGGHHITDIVGDYAFYRLILDMILPIILNKEVYLLPQTIGYFKTETQNKNHLVEYVLKNAKLIGVRDNNSKEFISKYDCSHYEILPDMVYGLNDYLKNNIQVDRNKNIGIALYGNYSGEGAKEKLYSYLTELAKSINILCKNGWKINFIPMEIKDTNADDRKLMKYIIDRVDERYRKNILVNEVDETNILETIKAFAKNEIIIAYKTHSVVFSLIQSIPVLGIAYHQKSIDFMSEYKLDEYCIWDKDATCDNIVKKINDIDKDYEKIKIVERKNADKLSERLDELIIKIIS